LANKPVLINKKKALAFSGKAGLLTSLKLFSFVPNSHKNNFQNLPYKNFNFLKITIARHFRGSQKLSYPINLRSPTSLLLDLSTKVMAACLKGQGRSLYI